jgi:hypothetical protein
MEYDICISFQHYTESNAESSKAGDEEATQSDAVLHTIENKPDAQKDEEESVRKRSRS